MPSPLSSSRIAADVSCFDYTTTGFQVTGTLRTGPALDLVLQDDILYLARGSEGLAIFDVSQPGFHGVVVLSRRSHQALGPISARIATFAGAGRYGAVRGSGHPRRKAVPFFDLTGRFSGLTIPLSVQVESCLRAPDRQRGLSGAANPETTPVQDLIKIP